MESGALPIYYMCLKIKKGGNKRKGKRKSAKVAFHKDCIKSKSEPDVWTQFVPIK